MIINNLVTDMYSTELLSGGHMRRIDSLPTDEEKTEYFLSKVIKPGLEIKYIKQFDEMLRLMKTSDDCTITYLVDEIQKFKAGSAQAAVNPTALVGEMQAMAKGYYLL